MPENTALGSLPTGKWTSQRFRQLATELGSTTGNENVLAGLSEIVGKTVDKAWKENVPMDARIFLETLLGDRGKEITEDRFTREELGQFEETIQQSQVIGQDIAEQEARLQEDALRKAEDYQATIDNLPRLLPQLEEASRTDPEWGEFRGADEGPRKEELYESLTTRYGELLGAATQLSPQTMQPNNLSSKPGKETIMDILKMDPQVFHERLINLDADLEWYEDLVDRQLGHAKWLGERLDRRFGEASSGNVTYDEYGPGYVDFLSGSMGQDTADQEIKHPSPYVSGSGPNRTGTVLGQFSHSLDSPDQRRIWDNYNFDEGLYEQYQGLGHIDKARMVAGQIFGDLTGRQETSLPQPAFTTDSEGNEVVTMSKNVNAPRNINDPSKNVYPWWQMAGQVLGEAYIGDEGRPVNITYPISSALGTLNNPREIAAGVAATLTSQERGIVDYHRKNLGGGYKAPDGRPMTVFAVGPKIRTGPHAGKYASVPGFVPGHNDNNPMNDDQALEYWQAEIDEGKWPIYDSADELGRRSKDIHTIMDVDMEDYVPRKTLGTMPR